MTDLQCVLLHRTDPDRPRRALDGAWICAGHATQVRRHTAQLPALYAVLSEPQATVGSGGRVSGSPADTDPLSPSAVERRDEIRSHLTTWARLVVDERGVVGPAVDELGAIAAWLDRHAGWLAAHPAAGEWVSETDDVHRRAWNCAYQDRSWARIDLGHCTACGTGRVQATLHRHTDTMPDVVTCSDCCRSWSYLDWGQLGRLTVGEQWLTMPEIAAALRVPIGTADSWASRDRWDRTLTRPTRYRLAEADETRRRIDQGISMVQAVHRRLDEIVPRVGVSSGQALAS